MTVEIEGKERKLKDVFSNEFAFTIPLYQRPYRWGVEQAGDLLDDLLTAATTEDDEVGQLDPYFLGSIVLVKKKHETEAEVLDGQQRLTTLAILIASLRVAGAADQTYARNLGKYLYEEGNEIEGTVDRFRLRLREVDQEYFEQHVLRATGFELLRNGIPKTEGQQNVRNNGLMLLERVTALSPDKQRRLAAFMMTRCFLVVVSTQDFDSAYRIFSVLNDRGLDLSYTDILKAEVVGALQNPEEKSAYAKRWEAIEEELKAETLEQLFSHIRMIRLKSKLRVTLLKDFREKIRPRDDPKGFIDTVLQPFSEVFQELLANHIEFADTAKESTEIDALLTMLRRVDHSEWLPPALLFITKHRNAPAETLRFFRDLERLAAGLMILRRYRDARITRYAKVLKAIEEGADLGADGSPLQLEPAERREILTKLQADVYFTGSTAKLTLLLLLRLDTALAGAEARYDHATISVEHVLPQSPAKDSTWVKLFNLEQRSQLVNKLGNLVLLARRKNSAASNYDFKKKKEKYFASDGGVSPFALTTQVLKEGDWNPDVIARRQAECVQRLRDLWRL